MSIEPIIESGRRIIETTLIDTCRIDRPTRAADGSGGMTLTWTTVAAAVACRFGSVIDPDPTRQLGVIEGPQTTAVLMALGTTVLRGDRLINLTSGKVWLVVGFKTADSATAVAQRILVTAL